MSAELDFDSLCFNPTSSSSAPVVVLATSTDSDLVTLLRGQLADSHQALAELRKIVTDRIGAEMGLESVAKDEVVVKKNKGMVEEGKGDGKGKERDDDSHYFESYAYNGSLRLSRRSLQHDDPDATLTL